MASYENRKRQKNQRCDQPASPVAILLQNVQLEPVDTRFEPFFRRSPLISRANWFLRHERHLSFLIFFE